MDWVNEGDKGGGGGGVMKINAKVQEKKILSKRGGVRWKIRIFEEWDEISGGEGLKVGLLWKTKIEILSVCFSPLFHLHFPQE